MHHSGPAHGRYQRDILIKLLFLTQHEGLHKRADRIGKQPADQLQELFPAFSRKFKLQCREKRKHHAAQGKPHEACRCSKRRVPQRSRPPARASGKCRRSKKKACKRAENRRYRAENGAEHSHGKTARRDCKLSHRDPSKSEIRPSLRHPPQEARPHLRVLPGQVHPPD